MGNFSKYPYLNFSDYNLDWIIRTVKEVNDRLNIYIDNSVITFADPITWDITEQYTALTVVVDADGTAYISKQPVPSGIDISNTDYWVPIFNYDDNINKLRAQIAYNAQTTPYATVDLAKGCLVFYEGTLYHTLVDLPAGTTFINGTNVEPYTVDEKIESILNTADSIRDDISYNAGESATAGQDIAKGDLVSWQNKLYIALTDIANGSAFVEGTNVAAYTIDEKLNDAIENADDIRPDISYDAADDATAADAIAEGDLVYWRKKLYRATTNIAAGNAFIVGTNIEVYTVDQKINDALDAVAAETAARIDDTDDIRSDIAYNAGTSATTAQALYAGDLVYWNNILYIVTADISVGGSFVVGTNITPSTVYERIRSGDFYYMPEWYGAKGDGVTDDTAAIQAMVNDMGYGAQAVFTKERYLISDTITIGVSFMSFAGGFGDSEWTPNIYAKTQITMFEVTSLGFHCYNIMFGGDRNQDPGSVNPWLCFEFDHDNALRQGDIDAIFWNCGFTFCRTGIHCKGRNVKVSDSSFSHVTYIGFHVEQCDDPNYSARGFEIVRNRFHSCTGSSSATCIQNDITDSSMKYFLVADNYVDFCNVFYIGTVGNATIQDNYVALCASSGIVLNAGNGNDIDVVIGNTLQGIGKTTPSQHGIDIRANAATVIVKDNVVYNYSLNGIFVRSGSKTVITGNVCRNNALAGGSNDMNIQATAAGVCNLNNTSGVINNGSTDMTLSDNYVLA